MCSKKGGVPFNGTAEQKEALLKVIEELKALEASRLTQKQ